MDEKAWSRGLSPEHKNVLAAGRRIAASADDKHAVWSALSAKLPAAAAAAAATTATTAHGLTLASLVKPLAVGLALGTGTAAGVVGVRLLSSDPPSVTSASPPKVAPEQRPAAPAARVSPEQGGAVELESPRAKAPSGTPRVVTPVAPGPPSAPAPDSTSSVASFPAEAAAGAPESATLRETRRLADARATWKSGDARAALTALDAIERDFPRGVLVQERDALRIQALAALGEGARAQALARRFLEQHPQSPHAAAVRRVLP